MRVVRKNSPRFSKGTNMIPFWSRSKKCLKCPKFQKYISLAKFKIMGGDKDAVFETSENVIVRKYKIWLGMGT